MNMTEAISAALMQILWAVLFFLRMKKYPVTNRESVVALSEA